VVGLYAGVDGDAVVAVAANTVSGSVFVMTRLSLRLSRLGRTLLSSTT
jgi:hypothetical protein